MSNQVAPETIHIFERAGLGKAPFRCVGSYESIYKPHPDAPARPGTSCDYCGTGIMSVFEIRGADGLTFKVGCECVRKTDDAGLRKVVDAIIKKARREHETARIATALEAFQQAGDAFQNSYPCLWAKIDFLFCMGEHAGKLKAARLFERHQAGDLRPSQEADQENNLRQQQIAENARYEAELRARQQTKSEALWRPK